jgi:hypothetical protein
MLGKVVKQDFKIYHFFSDRMRRDRKGSPHAVPSKKTSTCDENQ